MILSGDTGIQITAMALIGLVIFFFRLSWSISTFKSKIEDKVESLSKELTRHEIDIRSNNDSNQSLEVAFGKIETKLINIETILQKMCQNK